MADFEWEGSEQNLLESPARHHYLCSHGRKKYTAGIIFLLFLLIIGVVIGVVIAKYKANNTELSPERRQTKLTLSTTRNS